MCTNFVFFSANYEMSDDQLIGILEEIFCVNMAPSSTDGSRLTLAQVPDLVADIKSEVVSPPPQLDYREVVSNIILEVLVSMSNGKSQK